MTDKSKDKPRNGKGAAMTDMDSIDTLSLSIIPLSSATLKNARLVKNSRMETAVELHNDPISGSLQIQPDDIADAFTGCEQDQAIVKQLAGLHSYDVYSLRSSLKKLGIAALDPSALELSGQMKDSLAEYTTAFTRPLIEKIFGAGRIDIANGEGLQKIFRDPDVARVRENLKIMTERTGIPLEEIPKFLEEYSDVFLSVAYYRFSFESVADQIERFLFWTSELKSHRDVSSSPRTMASCKKVEDSLRYISMSIRERLQRFQKGFELFWSDINKTSFNNLRQQIEENHASMGAVLCGLLVKMRGWTKEFPDNSVGGPAKKIKYVMTELEPGIERLKILENDARARLGLSPLRI
jgi:hypothetical protein